MNASLSLKEQLLGQVPSLTAPEFAQYRQRLDLELARCLHQERRARTRLYGALAFVSLPYLGAVLLLRRPSELSEPVLFLLATAVLIAPVVVLIFAGLYFFKYRLHLHQARVRHDAAVLQDMQREIEALKARVAATEGPR